MLLRSAADDFLRFCALERQLSQHTLQAYAADLIDFQRWLSTDIAVAEVTTATLQAYLAALVRERKLSTATIRRRFACLKVFFRRLARQGDFVNPFASWQLQLPRRKRLPRALSRTEVSSLLGPSRHGGSLGMPARDLSLPLAMLLMISTGLRVGELCRLQIDDLSPEAASIRVHGKGSRDRVVYITDATLRERLRAMIERRRESGIPYNSLFLNRHGLPMKPQSIRSRLRRHAAEVGLARRVTPHMLRHTAATLLIETGVDIRIVQRLLGHSSIATTEIYTHVSDEALRMTLERADVLGMLS
jgi:site-specific recombinase XerD